MYVDVREKVSGSDSEDGVIKLIKGMEPEEEQKKTAAFRNQYVNFYGSAAKAAVDCIARELKI